MHDVEATSPLPDDDITATNICISTTSTAGVDATPLGRVEVNECTVYSHDEELFSESTLEQTTTFEQTREVFDHQDGRREPEEDEILAEVTVDQKSGFEAKEEEILAEVS